MTARVLTGLALLGTLGCAGPVGPYGRARAYLEGTSGRDARPGDLWLRCSPEDAEVWVDEAPRAKCQELAARGLSLAAGMHRVEVKKDGYAPYLTYCDPGGARAALSVTLEPLSGQGS